MTYLSKVTVKDLWDGFGNQNLNFSIEQVSSLENDQSKLLSQLCLHSFHEKLSKYTESECSHEYLQEMPDLDHAKAAETLRQMITDSQKNASDASVLAKLTSLRQDFEEYLLVFSLSKQYNETVKRDFDLMSQTLSSNKQSQDLLVDRIKRVETEITTLRVEVKKVSEAFELEIMKMADNNNRVQRELNAKINYEIELYSRKQEDRLGDIDKR